MPLDVTNIQIPIGAGVDEKTDQRLLPPGKVTGMVNGVYDKLGTVSKRKGYFALSTGSISGSITGSVSAIPTFERLAAFGSELVGLDSSGGFLYAYADRSALWSQVDQIPTVSARRKSIVQSTSNIATADVISIGGYTLYAWTGNAVESGGVSVGDVYILIVDEETGAVCLPQTPLTQTGPGQGLNPKIVQSGATTATVVFMEYPTNAIRAATISLPAGSQPYILKQKSIATATPVGWGLPHDVVADPVTGIVYLVYNTSSGGFSYITIDTVLATSLAAISSSTTHVANVPFMWSLCASFFGNDAGTQKVIDVGYSYQTASVNYCAHRRYEGLLTAPSPLTPITSEMKMYGDHSSLGNTQAFWMGSVTPHQDTCYINMMTGRGDTLPVTFARAQQLRINGSVTQITGYPQRVTPWIQSLSKPFCVPAPVSGGYKVYTFGKLFQYNSSVESTLQGTMFLFDTGADNTQVTNLQWRPVATVAPRLANSPGIIPFQNFSYLSNVASSSLSPRKYKSMGIILQSNESTGRGGLNEVEFDFSPLTMYDTCEVGENVHFSAGVPSYYDGLHTGEIGFLVFPDMDILETGQLVPANTGGQMNGPGAYQYAIVYEFIDAQGQRHQSAPSVQKTVSTTGAGYVNKVTLHIPTLGIQCRQTQLLTGSASAAAVVYRSEMDGTILYRRTDEISPVELINNPLSSSLTFVDTKSDETLSLSSRAPLYTQGGVLPNFCPPSARLATSHVGRVWLAGTDDPKRVWYSKQLEPGEALAFNDDLAFSVDDGGDITAIRGMDDKMIIFKSDRIFFVSGEGPTSLGTQNDLSSPIPIPSDVGCINPRSVVLTPDGIMFQSTIGIMLLTRALEVINIGYPVVDKLTRYPTISSAVVHPYQSQVRFTCGLLNDSSPFRSPGVTLVYDYLAKAWSVFEIFDGVNSLSSSMASSAVIHAGNYKWSSAVGLYGTGSTGAVFSENDSSGSFAWADCSTYVPMTVETAWVATNDIQGFQRVRRAMSLGEVHDRCTVSLSVANDYSENYVQSASFNYTAPATVAQNEIHIGQQKCQAIRIKVEDTIPIPETFPMSGTFDSGRGLTLTRVTLRAGTKVGTTKLPPGKRA